MIDFLFSPKGRISATQFFSYIAIAMLVMVVIGFALGTLPAINGPIILNLCWLLQVWPLGCILLKRLHDTGRSGIWLWLLAPQIAITLISLAMNSYIPGAILWLMTILGMIANSLCWGLILFLTLKTGSDGDNLYGPDPHTTRTGHG